MLAVGAVGGERRGRELAGCAGSPSSPALRARPRPPPAAPPPAPGKARALGERRCSAAGSRAERSAWRAPRHPRPSAAAHARRAPGPRPSPALRCAARPGGGGAGAGDGAGAGAGEAGPGRRAAAGMRGWRRNLALCLQRLPDEGRKRPLPGPASTGAARGAEGGPSAKLAGGTGRGSPREAKGGRPRPRSGACGVTAGRAARSGAWPGKPAGALRRARGGGTWGLAAARGWSAASEPSRAQPRTRSRVRFPERALAGAATTCLPSPGEFAGGRTVQVLSAGDFGSRRCSHRDPTFLRTPGSTPAPTPRSAVRQSCKEAGGGRECRGGG